MTEAAREAKKVRTAAGLTLSSAARQAGISTDYLRRLERQGGTPYLLASRLARLYGCDMTRWLYGFHPVRSERDSQAFASRHASERPHAEDGGTGLSSTSSAFAATNASTTNGQR